MNTGLPQNDEANVTNLSELNDELTRGSRWLRSLYHWNPNGVFALDREGRFVALNPACERIMGYPPEELLGRHFFEVTPQESRDIALQGYLQALAGGCVRVRMDGFARDGSIRTMDVSIAPLPVVSGVGGVLVMAHDVTQRLQAEAERDRTEAALQQSEERYRSFIAQSSEAIWRYELIQPVSLSLPLDEQIDLIYEHAVLAECNDTMARIYGYENAEAAVGRKLAELLPRTPINEAQLRAFAQSGWRQDNIESSRIEANGETSHYIATLIGIIEDGHVVRAWGTRRDITERKAAENRLRESERRLSLALRAGQLGTWEWNLDSRVLFCSPLALHILGLDTNRVVLSSDAVLARVHFEDRAQIREAVRETAATGALLETEFRVVWPDGSVHWVSAVGSLGASENETKHLIGTCRDITPHRRRERHQAIIAEASQAFASSLDLSTTLGTVAQLLVPTHADWCVIDLLDDASDNSGDIPDDAAPDAPRRFEGCHVAVAHVDPQREHFLWSMKSLADDGLFRITGKGDDGELSNPVHLPHADEDDLHALWPDAAQREAVSNAGLHSLMVVPLRARGRTLGILTLATTRPDWVYDEHDLMLAEDLARRAALAADNARLYGEAEAARREAEAANRAKDDFLAIVSHELRTPLTPLLGWIDLINAGRLDAAQSDRAHEAIGRNAHAQLQLVNDLLDVSRIISGKLPIDVRRCDWREPIGDAVESARGAAAAKQISLVWQAPSHEIAVEGDANRLQQVVTNLLSNAIKFTPAGGQINVSLSTVENDRTQPNAAHAVMEVTDSGAGIAAEFLPHIWERFRQADATTTRRHGGLGLGLAIVRHIMQAHGGKAEATSPGSGQGTTFRVRLPLCAARADDAVPAVETAPSAKELHGAILLLDDDRDVREMLSEMVGAWGFEARTAESSEEAFRILEQWRPDVIMSDIAMPEADGYEFLKRLQASEFHAIPVVALTAYAREEDRRHALEAGYKAHLCKPVDAHALLQALGALIAA